MIVNLNYFIKNTLHVVGKIFIINILKFYNITHDSYYYILQSRNVLYLFMFVQIFIFEFFDLIVNCIKLHNIRNQMVYLK